MCGISIIITPNKTIDQEFLKRMNDKIAHRGPDGEGVYINDEVGFGIGHRRLSIIDLSEAGHQPMHWKDKYVITYNGEIYNYIELRNELIKIGYEFSTQTDTEVILAAFDCWGKECINKFNGMWAFCIFDKIHQKVFLFRDRFGVKPLYYIISGEDIYAGSEIKQLLETGIVSRKPNMEVLMNYLVLGLVEQDHQTFFESVYSIPPSHFLEFDFKTKKYSIERYYTLKINDHIRSLNDEDAIKGYHQLLRNSIQLRLRSDVKVGTCLSGGLDSSYIASVASTEFNHANGQKFIGITASSLDETNNETNWAKIVAEKASLDWKTLMPTKDDFSSKLEEVIYCQEEPFGTPSVFMQNFVMEKSASLGCTVLLDGQGGDETLLGYERYYFSYLNGLSFINKIKAFLKIQKHSKLSLLQALLMQVYFNNYKLRKFISTYRRKNIKKKYLKKVNWGHLKKITKEANNIDTNQLLEITNTCLPHLLKYEDKNSMWHSIETRLPFIDYRLVEYSISIDPELKIKDGWTKFVLRKGSENILPDEIRWRKNKYGFESPDKVWLSDKAPLIKTISESPLINNITNTLPDFSNNYELLWKYYNIAIWEKQFNIIL